MTLTSGDLFMAVLSSAREIPLSGPNGGLSVLESILCKHDKSLGNKWDFLEWLLTMEELGFLCVDFKRKKIVLEGPFFYRSAESRSQIFVTGARTPEFLTSIKNTASQESLTFASLNVGDFYPAKISVKGNTGRLKSFATRMNLSFPPVPKAYYDSCQPLILEDLVTKEQLCRVNLQDAKPTSFQEAIELLSPLFLTTDIQAHQELKFFNPTTLKYDGSPPDSQNPYVLGRRELYGTSEELYAYLDSKIKVCTSIDKRYAKYFCLSSSEKKLGYNKSKKELLLPKYCRLPLKFSRCLSLCKHEPAKNVTLNQRESKRLGYKNQKEFLVYEGVPEVIKSIIGDKLNISFIQVDY